MSCGEGLEKESTYFIGAEGRNFFYLPGSYQWRETANEHGVVEPVGSFGMLARVANELIDFCVKCPRFRSRKD